MNQAEIATKIAKMSEEIAKKIKSGKDIEICGTSNGISVKEVSKKKII